MLHIFLTVAYATNYTPFMNPSSERRKINGEWVKALRKDLNLGQEELAERLGVSRSAVARWEADAFRPTKLAAKVLLEFADNARAPKNTPAQPGAAPSIEPHDRIESHSQRREGEHEPGKPGKPPAQP